MNHKWWNCIKQWLGKYWWVVILLSFAYPADIVVNYNAYASEADYQRLYCGSSEPEFLLGVGYAPLRSMFQNIPAREQKKECLGYSIVHWWFR